QTTGDHRVAGRNRNVGTTATTGTTGSASAAERFAKTRTAVAARSALTAEEATGSGTEVVRAASTRETERLTCAHATETVGLGSRTHTATSATRRAFEFARNRARAGFVQDLAHAEPELRQVHARGFVVLRTFDTHHAGGAL